MGFFDDLVGFWGRSTMNSLTDHVRIESLDSPENLVMKDGTLVSLLRLDGMTRSPGNEDIMEIADRMRVSLSPYLGRPGHVMGFYFVRDPQAAKVDMKRMSARAERSAAEMQLTISDLLSERQSILSEKLVSESTYVMLCTRTSVLNKEERLFDKEAVRNRIKSQAPMADSQIHYTTWDTMAVRHGGFVKSVLGIMKDTHQMASLLTPREALIRMKAFIDAGFDGRAASWEPNMPAIALPEAGKEEDIPHGTMPGGGRIITAPSSPSEIGLMDFSNFGVPTFDRQLCTDDAEILDPRSVRIGDLYYSSFDLSVAPEVLTGFNTLVTSMNARFSQVPWRCSFLIESGGVQAMSMKYLYLSVLAITSRNHNDRIFEALQQNRMIDGKYDSIVRFRATFTTWDHNRKKLRVNAQAIQNAVSEWGNSKVDGISGDPIATTLSTVPGVTLASTAPVAAGPLTDILALSPIGRQACPWRTGSLMFRTKSGKPWPYEPGSSMQSAWTTLICGRPGSGKSVLLNALNLGTILSSTSYGADLPMITIIDIGPSSSGLISLIREALPPELQHLAISKRMSTHIDNSINVFDTPLGARFPTTQDENFLINFLSIVCTDGVTPIGSEMTGLIRAIIHEAYQQHAPGGSAAKIYNYGVSPLVDQALKEIGYTPRTSPQELWWTIVDVLTTKQKVVEANIAQRFAVPTMLSLTSILSASDSIKNTYEDTMVPNSKETVIKAFQRMMSEVTREYPFLANETRLDISDARIISFDLKDVTAQGESASAVKQTAIMYMLARQIGTRSFFREEDDFKAMYKAGKIPKMYVPYHIHTIRANRQVWKCVCYDEYHRAAKSPSVKSQVFLDSREGRKFKMMLNVISQLPQDFDVDLMAQATGFIACENLTEAGIEHVRKSFQVKETDREILTRNLNGVIPGEGSVLWSAFLVKGYGQFSQELMLTLGPIELWAFSTTATDTSIRQLIYEKLGPGEARRVLARRFPSGSAEKAILARIARIENEAERTGDNARANVINEFIDMLVQDSRAR